MNRVRQCDLVQGEVDVENKQGVLHCLVASASGVDYLVMPFSVPDAATPHVLIDNERSGPLIIRYQHASRGHSMLEVLSDEFVFCLLVSISFRESLNV